MWNHLACLLPLLTWSCSSDSSTPALPSAHVPSDAGWRTDVESAECRAGIEFLLARPLQPVEWSEWQTAIAELRTRDAIEANAYEWTLRQAARIQDLGSDPIDNEGHRLALYAQFYFQICRQTESRSYDDLATKWKRLSLPLARWWFEQDPPILEDHARQVVLSRISMARFEQAYDLFGEVVEVPELQLNAGRAKEAEETRQGFFDENRDPKAFYGISATLGVGTGEWRAADELGRQSLHDAALPAFERSGLWGIVSPLAAWTRDRVYQRMTAEPNRIASAGNVWLVKQELHWAIRLWEIARHQPADAAVQNAIAAYLRSGFEADPGTFNKNVLSSLDSLAGDLAKGRRAGLWADYELGTMRKARMDGLYLQPLFALTAQGAAPLEARLEGTNGSQFWSSWHAQCHGMYGQFVAQVAGAPQPDKAEIERQAARIQRRFEEDPESRLFLAEYPLFFGDLLNAWMEMPPALREACRREAHRLYAETGSLAAASRPLSRVSIAMRKIRKDESLVAFRGAMMDLAGREALFQSLIASNARTLNAMSQATAVTGGAITDSIDYTAGQLHIDGELHQNPYSDAQLLGLDLAVGSLSPMYEGALQGEIDSARAHFDYLIQQSTLVDSGGWSE
ncbi:MAG: hypothetical protein R3E96_12180 [Planctomycetota bacterium]